MKPFTRPIAVALLSVWSAVALDAIGATPTQAADTTQAEDCKRQEKRSPDCPRDAGGGPSGSGTGGSARPSGSGGSGGSPSSGSGPGVTVSGGGGGWANSCRPVVSVVVAFQAGGPVDMTARLVSAKLGEKIGRPLVVDNVAGGGGTLGAKRVAEARGNGCRLLFSSSAPIVVAQSLYKKLPYDPARDLAAVSRIAENQFVLVVHPSVAAKTIREMIALAKAKPGQFTFGSTGIGSVSHLTGALFEQIAGIKTLHVPYKGSADVTVALLGGHTAMGWLGTSAGLPHIKRGALRPLAVSGEKRTPPLADVPTVAESGLKGFQAGSWVGVFVPAGVSRQIVEEIDSTIQTVLRQPDLHNKLVAGGIEPSHMGPAAFEKSLQVEREKWAKVVRQVGIQPE